MIKFCIALALLATISLSANCVTNVILLTNADCYCEASGTTDAKHICVASGSCVLKDPPTTHYCKQVGTTYTIEPFPAHCSASTYLRVGIVINAQYTGADCKIDDDDTAGNKICTQNGVYKASATSCPLMPADSPLCANLDAFKLTTTTAVNDKYKGALCTLKLASGGTTTTVCPPDTVYKASITSCPLIPDPCTTEQKTKKFATVIGGDGCQCETDKFCAAAKFCYDGACNDAAKLCSAMTAEECDGLDRTASTCLDAGCDKLTCCEGFKVSSAFTMGVQTAVIVGLMTFM